MFPSLPVQPSPISQEQAAGMNAVVLAFVGDAVYTLYQRAGLALSSTAKSGELHRRAAAEVNAFAQARRMEVLLPLLTERELAVYKRARNSKTANVAKNADIADYKKATGMEALIGFLYISGQNERLKVLLLQNNV